MESNRDAGLAVLTSRVRLEERLIFEELERRRIPFQRVDEGDLVVDLCLRDGRYAGVLSRLLSHTSSVYASRIFEAQGVPVINSSGVIATCGDKVLTNLALVRAGVPTPRTVVAMTPEAALDAMAAVGYPLVLKPVIGSWGRLVAKVNDREAAEALVEHKQALRSSAHSVFYIQEYVDKGGRDIRTIVVGDRVISAIYRCSTHWITNTARGARAEPCELTAALSTLSLRAAEAVGGGALAVDIIERSDGTLLVSEINHTMEFRGTLAGAGVNPATSLVDYVREVVGL